jgi:hypothetical protein
VRYGVQVECAMLYARSLVTCAGAQLHACELESLRHYSTDSKCRLTLRAPSRADF